ncbi:hypothetical protein ACJDU8_19735 [Clostridium sp. WILCCON 0269]|uniref:Uncharacterized protein n=1 Tax=Candidatus Clostridium eludens TaxID=3381663 RepID=A0ABW8SQ44_9CLOT
MVTKRKVKSKKYEKLGIKKNSTGDFEYINPEDRDKSKYQSIIK